MEKRLTGIIYNAKCAYCGRPVTNPKDWKKHEVCKPDALINKPNRSLCKDCGSQNLQPGGGCMVCIECGWESCKG